VLQAGFTHNLINDFMSNNALYIMNLHRVIEIVDP
jgi:hypothetical protein